MFSKHSGLALLDLSSDLRDEQDWKAAPLRSFDFPLNVTSFAIEPISGLLAAGTASGAIYIFGGPGVESKITLPEPVGVRFLHFSISTYNIICLDDNNLLHVWDLLDSGRPKLVATARFDQINSVTLSPSHSHVFLATHKGEIKTYDLQCLRKSPYAMPDMWKLYDADLAASGVPALALPTPSTAVDSVIHPRNLNLMFVAYAGGIILTDLTERNTVRAYELILPPGAPGGAGYAMGDILTHRRSTVTCLAVHPSGHIFAVGYADGSFAFWATEDDNKPLLVQTLDSADVNLVDAEILESHLGGDKGPTRQPIREPIFKLTWSSYLNSADPRGGDTTLTVLGGLDAGKPPGLTLLLLPPFNPTAPPADQPAVPDTLHPHFRGAMRKALVPTKSFYYRTSGTVQDFLLLPKASPHLSGAFDPYAILLLVESSDGTRTVTAYQYPPPGIIQTPLDAQPGDAPDTDEDESLPTPQQSPPPPMPLQKGARHLVAPSKLRTPFSLSPGVLGGYLHRLDNDIYQDFLEKNIVHSFDLQLKGGQAYPDATHANELKLSKYQPHRILVTFDRGSSVHFFDASAQVLIPRNTESKLEHDYPNPLPSLSINLDELRDDSIFCVALSTRPEDISIQSVLIAPDALECAIILNSGEAIVYHPSQTPSRALPPRALTNIEITSLVHITSNTGKRFNPYFMIGGRGPVETCAISDIGFLAIAYKDASLLVIDMRGPNIILSQGMSKRAKHSSLISHMPGGASHIGIDVVKALAWTISPLEKDPALSVRLVAARQSGNAEVYSLVHSGSPVSWSVSGEPITFKTVTDPLENGLFLIDGKTGGRWRADRTRLSASYNGMQPVDGINGSAFCVLVSVGAKGARSCPNIIGEKVGKADWGHKGASVVQSAQIIEHLGSHALIVQTDHHDALVYSLPHLEYLHTIQVPTISPLPLSIDESGDFVAWTPHPKYGIIQSANYGTFFNSRRAYTLPDIDFASTRGVVPPQPQPVSLGPASYLGSWFSFNQTLSGNQIDELLGGPDRPIPQKLVTERAGSDEEGVAGSAAGAAAGLAASAAAVQTNLYNKLSSAMSERGQLLGDLEERFNSLEEGSRNMVTQAKRLAAQQTAKGWFGF